MRAFWRWSILCVITLLCLEIFFIGRIAFMAAVDPQSTAFQRSEAWRIVNTKGNLPWAQQWVDYSQISDNLKRAVIASEDDGFVSHDGVDWNALEKAWSKNAKAEQRADVKGTTKPPKVVGGSTITQQLAKNLFLSGERTLFRKAQEFVLTMALEILVGKKRILEIYLNSVEWGEGVFGAEAAAQHYFRKSASKLTAYEAARLVVMLPRPKYFEKTPNSAYLSGRAGVIAGRIPDAKLP
jgi:monofunctional biosynthetic peptidoglycan transglycosylase